MTRLSKLQKTTVRAGGGGKRPATPGDGRLLWGNSGPGAADGGGGKRSTPVCEPWEFQEAGLGCEGTGDVGEEALFREGGR